MIRNPSFPFLLLNGAIIATIIVALFTLQNPLALLGLLLLRDMPIITTSDIVDTCPDDYGGSGTAFNR